MTQESDVASHLVEIDAPSREKKPIQIFQLKIRLRGITPRIWRRIEVPAHIKLHQLHLYFQGAMGWTNSHLYEFKINGVSYGFPDPEFEDNGIEMKSANETRLNEVVSGPGSRFTYIYDMGDNWRHAVVVEKISSVLSAKHYPRCLGGERACPPEDCGGADGYENLLEAIADPKHEEHKTMLQWLGGSFDPEAFSTMDAYIAMRQKPPKGQDLFDEK